MKTINKVIKEDLAGLVEIEELTELTASEDVTGAKGIIGPPTITGSMGFCPTIKCTLKC